MPPLEKPTFQGLTRKLRLLSFTVMPGAFGLLDGWHAQEVPQDRLTDSHPCLDCFRLAQEGLLRDGASGALQTARGEYHIAAREGGILIGGMFIAMRSHPLNGRNFICPRCRQGCYRIYEADGWACRTCHGLDYPSRHRHRTIPGYNRILYLRRRIGASPVPFSPIAPKRRNASRYWRIVAEIRRLESSLTSHARNDVANVLDRREKQR